MAEGIGNALSAPASVVGHGTVWQVRVDRWSAIADLARRLADATAPAPAHEERERELGELFELVSPLEHYWAVPGPKRVAELRGLYAAGDYEALVAAVEPIARRLAPWWSAWQSAFSAAGGRSDEWRLPSALPPRQRQLAKAAGLNPQEMTARTLCLGAAAGGNEALR